MDVLFWIRYGGYLLLSGSKMISIASCFVCCTLTRIKYLQRIPPPVLLKTITKLPKREKKKEEKKKKKDVSEKKNKNKKIKKTYLICRLEIVSTISTIYR